MITAKTMQIVITYLVSTIILLFSGYVRSASVGGTAGACFDITKLKCGCSLHECSQELCAANGGIWSGLCLHYCNPDECGKKSHATIFDIAKDNGSFTTLLQAAESVDLIETLSSSTSELSK